jgi:hypothetical protein
MRKSMIYAAALTVTLLASSGMAWAAHNLITLSAPVVTRSGFETWLISGTVSVRNTTANAQTGQLTYVVFEIQFDGSVVERARKDLGIVNLPGGNGTTVNVPYVLPFRQKGSFLVLADFSSATASGPVPHTHAGTFPIRID